MNNTAFNEPPEWSKQVILYQIFVERFYNGDKSNDPTPANISIPMKIKFLKTGLLLHGHMTGSDMSLGKPVNHSVKLCNTEGMGEISRGY